jgi:hypothetical protein
LGKDTAFIEELLMAAGKYEIEKLKVSIIWRTKICLFRPVVKRSFSIMSILQPHLVIMHFLRSANVRSYVKKLLITLVKSIPNSPRTKNLKNWFVLIPNCQVKSRCL